MNAAQRGQHPRLLRGLPRLSNQLLSEIATWQNRIGDLHSVSPTIQHTTIIPGGLGTQGHAGFTSTVGRPA